MIDEAENVRANELIRAGLVAFADGDHQKAHDLWRQAAILRPHNEEVWVALLDVIDNPADRRVCLENILHINPHNQQAQLQLQALHQYQDIKEPEPPVPAPAEIPPKHKPLPVRHWLAAGLRLIVVVVVLAVLFFLGVAAGVLVSML